MSLVSTSPVAAAVTPAVDPVLYDSGWKSIVGNGSHTTIETFTYTVDATVHIYAKYYHDTAPEYFRIWDNYERSNGDMSTSGLQPQFRELESKGVGGMTSGTLLKHITYELVGDTVLTPAAAGDKSMETRNARGYVLEANKEMSFRHTSSLSTSKGIQYRAVVIRNSDGADMVNWANNA